MKNILLLMKSINKKRSFRKENFLLRPVALILLLTFITEVFYPTAALALTSGPTSPEVFGSQPVAATDNINLATGQFNYTIPITSIPEYPMAIGYSNGAGMEDEASSFGFGFNGFSGAVGRSMQGLPDDLDGAPVLFQSSNQEYIDISYSRSATVGAGETQVGDIGISTGISLTKVMGYNTYNGLYGAVGIGLSIGAKLKEGDDYKDVSPGLSLGLYSDSRYGAEASVGLSLPFYAFSASQNSNGERNRTSRFFAAEKDLIAAVKDLKEQVSVGISSFSSVGSIGASSLGPIADVNPSSYPTSTSATFTVPIYAGTATVSGKFDRMGGPNQVINRKSYGFMYLSNYQNKHNMDDRDHLADMTVEGEISFDSKHMNNPSYLQRDFFMVNTEGLAGSMQLFSENYGLVSRNYSRDITLDIKLGTIVPFVMKRKEVLPWHNVEKASVNKKIDIIDLLKDKKPENIDFDNTIFDSHELHSYNHKFQAPKLKMRGDMAGEFNLGSSNYSDDNYNDFDLRIISSTDVPAKYFFLGQEKVMPMYYVEPSGTSKNKFSSAGNIKRSTHIEKYTINDMAGSYSSSSFNTMSAFKKNQSFYSHYEYVKTSSTTSTSKAQMRKMNDHLSSFNVLNELNNLINQNTASSYLGKLIGGMQVTKADGMRYFFNLPAFAKNTRTLQLSGHMGEAPIISDDSKEYDTFKKNGNNKNRNKWKKEELFIYPYAWLLTAIVGPDYIDFDDIPGPSDGDLGYWVKFKYVRTANDYHWRSPFTGMDHLPAALHMTNDDQYMVSHGTKEIYNLAEVESGSHIAKYDYHKRYDGWDASGGNDMYYNGLPVNTLNRTEALTAADYTGNNYQFAVTQIDLYKKHASGDNSKAVQVNSSTLTPVYSDLIKSTKFEYDYSLCKNVPNNFQKYAGTKVKVGDVPYHYERAVNAATDIETGKLTLRKVQDIAYDHNGTSSALPSYQLFYDGITNSTTLDNPDYDRRQTDIWGNYMKSSKDGPHDVFKGSKKANNATAYPATFYSSYTELSKAEADNNSRSFALSRVELPTGGSLNVEYEAADYAHVQDRKPFNMRKIKSVAYLEASTTQLSNIKCTQLEVDISDLIAEGKNLSNVLVVNEEVYAELAYYQVNADNINYKPSPNDLFLSTGKSKILSIEAYTSGNTQKVTLYDPTDPLQKRPYKTPCEQYTKLESDKMRSIKENPNDCGTNPNFLQYGQQESASAINALNSMLSNARNAFQTSQTFLDKFSECLGTPCTGVYEHKSYLRTPVNKGKYTGSRVKSLTFKDGFRYGTEPNGTVNPAGTTNEGVYRTNYFYDSNEDGTGISEGVATIEPGGGESAVIDFYKTRGAGFYSAPRIMYRKTTVKTNYSDLNSNDGVVSRDKGKTVYNFFTPNDADYTFNSNFRQSHVSTDPGGADGRFFLLGIWTTLIVGKFKVFGKTITIKFPMFVPLAVRWKREDHYRVKSYAYNDYADIYGRPKSIIQKSAGGQEVSRKDFNYFGKKEAVPVVKGSPSLESDPFSDIKNGRPGKIDQVWSESYYTKQSVLKLIPAIYLLNAKTERNFNYTNMKYSYVPPVLKSVTSTLDGVKTTSEYSAFDYYTGLPLESKVNNSYKETKIERMIPAYWEYAEMGPADDNSSYTNMLTQTTGSYTYLNSVSNANLLSVGILEWDKDNWTVTPSLKASREYSATDNNFSYKYTPVTAAAGKAAFSTEEINSAKIKNRTNHYKPYRNYVYETDLTTDGSGRYSTFESFQYYPGTNSAKWKLANTNEIFDVHGNAVQSKDILQQYSSSYIGYNFSYTTGSVSNTKWEGSVFEGAENIYKDANGSVMLEGDRVKPADARVVSKDCTPNFDSYTMDYATLQANGAKIIKVCPPTPLYTAAPFAKINVTYTGNASQPVSRSLYISQNSAGEVNIISNRGEQFNGFFKVPVSTSGNCFYLAFDPQRFSAFTPDFQYETNGYSVSMPLTNVLPDCYNGSLSYKIPANNCVGEVHTGMYAFELDPGKTGSTFTLEKSSLVVGTDESQFKRAYKAMVWVHHTSAPSTKLTVQLQGATGNILATKQTTLATPYVTAGNWRLLRIDIPKENFSANVTKLVVSVSNPSANGISLYDDLCLVPYHAQMSNSVYDHKFGRVTEKLNNDHFATFYKYDSRGRLTEVKSEVESIGKQVVKQLKYNDQKLN